MRKPDAKQFEQFQEAKRALIPLHRPGPDGKKPLHKNWTKRRYTYEEIATKYAGHNIGVALAATDLVVDVDPRNGGKDGLAKLRAAFPEIAWKRAPRVVTGSGGLHLYFTKPAEIAVVNTLKEFPGIEFKSRGRQMLIPGDVHPDTGKLYEWRPESRPLAEAFAAPDNLLQKIARPEPTTGAEPGEITAEQLAGMLECLPVEEFREHDSWLKLMCAAHHATGGEGREEFIEWSTGDATFASHSEIIGRRWDSLSAKPGAITAKTLYRAVHDHGGGHLIPQGSTPDDDFDEDEHTRNDANEPNLQSAGDDGEHQLVAAARTNRIADTIGNALAAIHNERLGLVWDELKQKALFTCDALPWDESFGREVDDNTSRLARAVLVLKHQDRDYQPSRENVFEALMTLAYRRRINPVVDWLAQLKWDGKPRVHRLFADYFRCDDSEYTSEVSRRFMIGAVRRQRSPGCKFDTMPVIKGKQGLGKSKGIRALFGAAWFSDADLGNLANKDAAMLLRGIWVQEFAELDAMKRSESATLKSFCSRAWDRLRDPYGRVAKDNPRRCVFVGTVNESGYLKDPTGGRRFWPLKAKGLINFAAIERDREQLWAEAAHLEATGESDILPEHLWPAAAEMQKAETTADPWIDEISAALDQRQRDYYDSLGEMNSDDDLSLVRPPKKIHTSEIFHALRIDAERQSSTMAQRIRLAMESLGWRHRHSLRIGKRVSGGYFLPEAESASV
ncbi:MAG TPA: VapE domain-containing protein [Xanthobacteraceae bacterium]|nr:VapE domain-containing protein [Xanthobacteraceae bacterium]